MQRSRLLKIALIANGIFSAAAGAALAVAAPAIANSFGMHTRFPLLVLSPTLLLFGGTVIALARTARPQSGSLLVTVLDIAWVVGTAALLLAAWNSFSFSGRLTVALTTLSVATFAMLQLAGMRIVMRSDGTRGDYRNSIEVRRLVDVNPMLAWSMVSDLDRYAEFATGLHFSRVLEGNGVGLRRECGDHAGNSWTERCSVWEDGRVYAMEVDTNHPAYPHPLKAMRGEWRVSPVDGRSEISMRFDFTLKGGLLGEVIAATMMEHKRREMEAVLDQWQAAMETGRRSSAA